MLLRFVIGLLILAGLQEAASAGIEETYSRPGVSVWSTDVYARLIGRDAFRRSIAVVVGVGDYSGFPKLSAPAGDAMRMRDFLRDEAGFDQIVTLTDEQATYGRISELMEKIVPDLLGPNDRFLFYFSGHGMTRTLPTTKRGYLVLKNSVRGNWQDMIDMDRLKQWTENVAQARHSLFLLDACFSGLAAFEAKAGDVREKTLARLMQPGHYIVTAGTEGQETYIYRGESLFTQAFLSAARGEGIISGDGIVTLNEMMSRINRTLDARQAEIGDRIQMTPRQYYARISNNAGEFFFLPQMNRPPTAAGSSPPIKTEIPARTEPKTGLATGIPPTSLVVPPSTFDSGFEIRAGMEATGALVENYSDAGSMTECEQRCAKMARCGVYTYNRANRACYVYPFANLAPNDRFDSGVRRRSRPIGTEGNFDNGPRFELKAGMEATGALVEHWSYGGSIAECEQRCAKTEHCGVYTYNSVNRACYVFPSANLAPNERFDSGIRIK